MVDGTGLENRRGATHRGFESLLLRHETYSPIGAVFIGILSGESMKRFLTKRTLFFTGIYILFFLWSLYTLDPDFGWHLRAGQYFLTHGVPATDIFTFTAPDFPWVDHEWLSDIFVSLIYQVGSFWLLAAIYAGMWTTAVALVSRKVPSAIILAGVIAIMPFAGVRALTWSALLLALLYRILHAKQTKWQLLIPPLFLVWANVHGSFLIGIAYGGWVMVQRRSWRLCVLGCISLAFTFVNPYGYHVYTEIFRTMLDGNLSANIVEWQRFALPIAAAPYALLWVALMVYVNQRRWREYITFDTLLFVWSCLSMRMTPLFVLMSLTSIPSLIRRLASTIPKPDLPRATRLARRGLQLLVVVCLLVPILSSMLTRTGIRYPVQAVTYLKANPCKGNIFNSYNFGGFLIWQLPDTKVYIDGRMPSWKHDGKDYMATYNQVLADKSVRDTEFSRFDIRCAVIENTSPLYSELQREGWQVRSTDGATSVLTSY